MAILLVHVIFSKKTAGADLTRALDDIDRNHRLTPNQGTHGYGVYAYFAGEVPARAKHEPLVVFQCEDAAVKRVGPDSQPFAFIRTPIFSVYLRIDFLGFINAPPGYTSYTGQDPL